MPLAFEILITQWIIAFTGMIIYLYINSKSKFFKTFETCLYLIMGWMGIFIWNDLKKEIKSEGSDMLMYSGLFYTVGVVFFLIGKSKPVNFILHLPIIYKYC